MLPSAAFLLKEAYPSFVGNKVYRTTLKEQINAGDSSFII